MVFVDQMVKAAAVRPATSGELLRNTGFATGWSPVSSAAVIGMSALVVIAFVAVIGRWAVQLGISAMIPALVVGGMVAHSLDRVLYGGVRDFIHTPWLIIDIADLAIVTGVVALAIAFAVRALQLRAESRVIGLELPTLRAVIREA